MFSKVLIIDKRRELSTKYKKSLEDGEISVTVAKTLKDAIVGLQEQEPDLILVSDSIDEKLTDFCEKIRALTYNTRPIIVALSKSADSGDRILTLESGADDFLSEPVNIEEFKTRIRAHLRRDIESNLDNKTLLPNKKIVEKTLKRINQIIKDIVRDPFNGIAKPEPLKGSLTGFWSRRIDSTNRIVYAVESDAILIIECRTHYEQ
jgi:toxin YoeB